MSNPKRKIPRREIEEVCSALLEEGSDDEGICICCGETQSGVEPDAENYECESCGERGVFGAEQALIMFAY